jgi:hypothetical protein
MRRRTLCLLLLLQLAPGGIAEAPAQTPAVVGHLIASQPAVLGGIPPAKALPLAKGPGKKPPEIRLRMQVETKRRGRADIVLQRGRKGKLLLGPGTQVLFNEQLVEGRPPVMTLRQQVGQLRLVLIPRAIEPGEGEYWIETEAGVVRVLGTDVYVRAGRWGMVVAVVEGEVEVESKAGGQVVVREGEWTYVAVGRPPQPPRPIDPNGGPSRPPDGGVDVVVDPPELRDLRFDLPR